MRDDVLGSARRRSPSPRSRMHIVSELGCLVADHEAHLVVDNRALVALRGVANLELIRTREIGFFVLKFHASRSEVSKWAAVKAVWPHSTVFAVSRSKLGAAKASPNPGISVKLACNRHIPSAEGTAWEVSVFC